MNLIKVIQVLSLMLFLVVTITFLWDLIESIVKHNKRKKTKEEIQIKLKDFYIKYDGLIKDILVNRPKEYTEKEWKESLIIFLSQYNIEMPTTKEDVENYWE
jgi:hypothetical protein